jgi:squalene-associated FAD-dependent desaturase
VSGLPGPRPPLAAGAVARTTTVGDAGGATAAVVGGGLAGITAAIRLADQGFAVTLLEARPRLGGATHSWVRDGLSVDNGQHVFLRCCTAYRELLDRLGVASLVELQPRLDIPVLRPGGRVARLRRDGLRPPWHLARAIARYHPLPPADRLRLLPALTALRQVDPADPAADRTRFADFLAAHLQRPAAVDRLWGLIATPTLNVAPDEASLAAAAFVFRAGLLERADAADIGISRVPLSDLHGNPAERVLAEAGVTIRRGAKVSELRPGDGAEQPYTLRLAGAAGEVADTVEADAVVCAVPHPAATTLLGPLGLPGPADWPQLGSSPIVDLHAVYDRPVSPFRFAAAVDSPVQWIFDRTGSAGNDGAIGQYLVVSLSAADRWIDRPSAELRAVFEPELRRLLPRAAEASLLRWYVSRERNATFRSKTGSGRLRPSARTVLPGLFLAGAWTATGWPDTMEGAVRSGNAAAVLAASYLAGRRARPRVVVP